MSKHESALETLTHRANLTLINLRQAKRAMELALALADERTPDQIVVPHSHAFWRTRDSIIEEALALVSSARRLRELVYRHDDSPSDAREPSHKRQESRRPAASRSPPRHDRRAQALPKPRAQFKPERAPASPARRQPPPRS